MATNSIDGRIDIYAVGTEVRNFCNDDRVKKMVFGTITEAGDDSFVVQWEDLEDPSEYIKSEVSWSGNEMWENKVGRFNSYPFP